MSTKTHVLKKINLSLSYYFILWPKRLRAESTHPENWPKRPTYQGRNDPPQKLAETTQAETTQAETTQDRNDPDSLMRVLFFLSKQEEETSERQSKSTKEGLRT